jgi:FKBP-type peptidyl-prolyl cis-trans isomerase FklB
MKHCYKIGALLLSLFLSFTISSVAIAADSPEMAKKQGDAFLQKNKSKKGVITLPSGLQYEVITQGTGKKPGPSDMVTVDYEGKLLNNQIFDSSYKRGQPAVFPVNGVIPGWTEALQLMNAGSTWILFVPSTLAYGEAGAGGLIGPNETLVFKVHLISVK